MIFVLLVIHIMVAISLVGVVLLQKSEGGALGIGGGGMSGFMTGRSTANLLTRATAILAAAFFSDERAAGRHAQSGARPGLDHRSGCPDDAGPTRYPDGAVDAHRTRRVHHRCPG